MDWLRQIPIGQYVDEGGGEGGRGSWLKRLDPRLKLLWTVAFLVTPILASAGWRIGLMALLLVISLASGLPLRLWRGTLPLLLALALLVGLLAAVLPVPGPAPAPLQRPPDELVLAPPPPGGLPPERSGLRWEILRLGPARLGGLELGPLLVTRRSAELALNSSTLLVTLIQSANLLLLSTPPEELVWAISWWLRPLRSLGWPVDRIGFTLLLALRFLPLVQEELQNLLRSLATRAVNLRALGWSGSLALLLAVGGRLLANVLLRAEQGAEALLARGGRWLMPEELHQPAASPGLATILGALALVMLVVLRVVVGGR